MNRDWLREWAALALVFAVLVAVAVIWLLLDSRPPVWDYANHLERAVRCAADLRVGDAQSVLARSALYPPLVPCTGGLAYLLAPSDTGAQAVILAFLALGMAATYWLARRFFGGPAGVVAALLFATAPLSVHLSVRFQLDLPLAAMVAATLALLLKTEGFSRPVWSAAAGLVIGLGMLTKPVFPVYVLPAIIAVAAGARTRGRLLQTALAAVLALAVCSPWYARRAFAIVPQMAAQAGRHGVEEGDPEVFTVAGLAWYPGHLPIQVGWLAAALVCVGIVVAVYRRRWLLVFSALAPLALFVLSRNKDLRYTLPLLPVAAVLAAAGFAAVPGRWRRGAAVVIVAAAALQVSASAFALPARWTLPVVGAPLGIASPPAAEDWGQRAILSIMERDARGAPHTVSVVPNHPFFSPSNFRYYAVRDGRPAEVIRAWENEPVGIDYMVFKSGDNGPEWTLGKARKVAERFARDPHLARVFPVLAEWPLPDGSTATIRARRPTADLDVPAAQMAATIEAVFRRRLAEFARDVDDLAVRLTYDDSIRRGHVGRVEVTAAAATVGDLERRQAALLRLRDVRIVFDDVLVNPYSAWLDERLAPLDVGELRVERATVTQDALTTFLAGLRKRRLSARLEQGAIAVRFILPGPDVTGRVRLLSGSDGGLEPVLEALRLGGLPMPDGVASWLMRQFDPRPGLQRRLRVQASLAPVTISPEALRIGRP